MRASSTTRSSPSSDRGRGPRSALGRRSLRTPSWWPGAGGHLGQVGHHEDLVALRPPRPARCPTAWAASPPTPASTSSKTMVRRRVGEHQAQRQHGPGQLAPRGHLGQGQHRLAGVGPQEEGDVVAGIVLAHGHLDPGVGHGQGPQALLDRARPARARPGAGPRPPRPRPRPPRPAPRRAQPASSPARVLGRVELGQLAPGLVGEGEHAGGPFAVLARQLAQQLAPRPHLGQALGVVLPGLDDLAQLRGDVGRVGLQRRQASRRAPSTGAARRGAARAVPSRSTTVRRPPSPLSRAASAPAAASRWAPWPRPDAPPPRPARRPRRGRRCRRRRSRRAGSAAGRPRGPGPGRRRRVTRARPPAPGAGPAPRAAGRGRSRRRRRGPGAARRRRAATGARAGRGGRPVARPASAKADDRRHAPVDPRPGAALGRDGAGQDDLRRRRATKRPSTSASVAPGRTRLGSARPPTSSSSASTSSVLPAPVSPVSAVIPGPRSRVTDSMTPRSRTRSSTSIGDGASAVGQVEPGPQDGVEVAGPEGDEAGRRRRRPAHHGVARFAARRDALPVDHEHGPARGPATSRRTHSSGSSTSGRSKSMCGEIGVSTMARRRGLRMGPRADRL